MHKLSRSEVPDALTSAYENCNDWNDPRMAFYRKSIADVLCQMQNSLCAYCESKLEVGGGHIEHFKKRSLFSHLTFSWENLFYSCNSEEHCGKQKDKNVKTIGDNLNLIDPSKDDPEHFFVFTYDGKIALRTDLSTNERERANVTIEAFNLNESALIQARKNTIRAYEWLKGYQDNIDEYLANLSLTTSYITAIHNFFNKRYVTC